MSIAHRIVSSKNNYVQFKQIVKQGLEVDIVFLSNFIGAGMRGNEFEEVEPYDVTTRTLKFPILEKSFCAIGDPGKSLQRARILSNRQFSLTTRYSELLARLKNRETPQNTHHVVLGFGDFFPWQGVIDELHNHAEWVICIDPNIDEKLIAQKSNDLLEAEMREIIGFGSGVGSHGEDNYTISTEQFHLSDVLHSLTASIGELYAGWANSYKEVAQSILRESRRLSGLSLVRATGLGEYIRDFMAYALTRKLISADENVLCDQLVSLDAYRHWFDSAESKTRPDLLWVVAQVGSDQRIHLDLKLIECKLAKMSDVHLDKAQLQLKNGLQHLIEVFMPRRDDNSIEDDRPDQRYWWLQLHRLIASKAKIIGYDQGRVLTALERMGEGDYSVKWGASAITYWTDQKNISLSLNAIWPFFFEGQELDIGVVYAGSDFVRDLCTSRISEILPWGEKMIRFDSVIQKLRSEEDKESGESETKEKDESGKTDVSRFPEPSKTVVSIKPEIAPKEQEAKMDIDLSIPQRILLGKTINGNRDVYWEFGHDELNNRHMLIFGASGMGKTYAIQCLLWELGRTGENSLIVDYTNGFFDSQLESEIKTLLRPVQHIIQKEPLAINPFRQQMVNIAGEFTPEGFVSTAQRVSGVFSEVYNFGDQQKSALYQAIKSWLELNTDKCMGLYNLIPRLKEIQEQKGVTGTSAGSVISKIQPFVDQNPFGIEDQESWNKIFNDFEHRCHIIQLAGFAKDAARLITEFLLIDLYWYYRGKGSKDNPHVLVLDEVQNLDHREESPLAQLLREGRKFGFSLILATQIMSNLEKDERDRLFNAAHKLFFRPADTEIKKYAEIAAIFTDEKVNAWIKKLASLKKGECYSLGPSLNESTGSLEFKAFHIVVTSLKDRSNFEKK
jgi:DNA phosphorothioation-dependent restriction protein DptH